MQSSTSQLGNGKTKAATLKFPHFSDCFVCLDSNGIPISVITYNFHKQDT